MDKDKLFDIVKELGYDNKKSIHSYDNAEIYIIRPSKLSKNFVNYDPSKNFQIWLRENNMDFRPNHLRILIDLNLRIKSRPDLKNKLLSAFDSIYYGEDPEKVLYSLKEENFNLYLNNLMTIGILHQLFLVEQEYSYNKESHFEPPSLFLQGWVREFMDSPKEIDNMCMSVAHGQPPINRYVSLENKKDKKYQNNLEGLWYIK